MKLRDLKLRGLKLQYWATPTVAQTSVPVVCDRTRKGMQRASFYRTVPDNPTDSLPKPVCPNRLMEKVRLSKLMAQRGLCSRREADAYIEKGWVRVDGQRINTLGTKIDPSQAIALDKRATARQDKLITILLNKPVGYVSSQPEDDHLEAVSLINQDNRYAYDTSKRLFQPIFRRGLAPAGRLDIDSQGLLILTADGRIARRLIGNDAEVEKEYLVRVTGDVTDAKLDRLRHGLSLDERPLKPAQVSRQNQDQLKFILVEGRKRQIRRMCELVDLEATSLKRVRIGEVKLGRLPEGQWRLMGDKERF